jgi:hypothetical protein
MLAMVYATPQAVLFATLVLLKESGEEAWL